MEIQGSIPQPEMFLVDATKAKSLEEMGIMLNALGLAMSEEYAKENGLEHLLVKPE